MAATEQALRSFREPGATVPASPADDLAAARRAWQSLNSAEATLDRLARYTQLTDGMKAERSRAHAKADEARATLARVLAVAA